MWYLIQVWSGGKIFTECYVYIKVTQPVRRNHAGWACFARQFGRSFQTCGKVSLWLVTKSNIIIEKEIHKKTSLFIFLKDYLPLKIANTGNFEKWTKIWLWYLFGNISIKEIQKKNQKKNFAKNKDFMRNRIVGPFQLFKHQVVNSIYLS